MLHKRYIEARDVYRVEFRLAQDELPLGTSIKNIVLVGDFNDWDAEAQPLRFNANDRTYFTAVDLEPGSQHQFRYFINDAIWVNDEQADDQVVNRVGTNNSVVIAE